MGKVLKGSLTLFGLMISSFACTGKSIRETASQTQFRAKSLENIPMSSSMSPQFFTAALRFVLGHEAVDKIDRGVDSIQISRSEENGEQFLVSFAYPQRCRTFYKVIYSSVQNPDNEFLDIVANSSDCPDEPKRQDFQCVLSHVSGSLDQRQQTRFMVSATYTINKQLLRLVIKEDRDIETSKPKIEGIIKDNQYSGFRLDSQEFTFQIAPGSILGNSVSYLKCEHPIYAGISIGN